MQATQALKLYSQHATHYGLAKSVKGQLCQTEGNMQGRTDEDIEGQTHLM